MLPRKYTANTALRIVVLLAPPPVQLLDLAPIDLFHMLRSDYLSGITIVPQSIKDLALPTLEIVYVADAGLVPSSPTSARTNDLLRDIERANIQLAPLTANVRLGIDKSISDPGVRPGPISILFIPGPKSNSLPTEACQRFIQAHAASGTTDIITICTGIYPACVSGVCDGKIVTGPRGSLSDLRRKFSDVKAFEDRRWSIDTLSISMLPDPPSESGSQSIAPTTTAIPVATEESAPTLMTNRSSSPPAKDPKSQALGGGQRPAELWTSGGMTNGHDAVAAYIRAHFDSGLADAVLRLADTGERRRDYDTGHTRENIWWAGTKLKTVLRGILPGNGKK